MDRKRLGLAGPVVVLGLIAMPSIAHGATINVTTTTDQIAAGGQCSLREAVIAANTDAVSGGCAAGNGTDTIVLPAGTYRLTITGNEDNTGNGTPNLPAVGDLDVTAAATIQGAGASKTTIDANGISRAFDGFAPLEIDDLTITGGRVPANYINPLAEDGGAIRAGDDLTLHDDVISDNQAATGSAGAAATSGSPAFGGAGDPGGDGGAVYAEKGLTVTGTMFTDNVAGAGGASGNARASDGAFTSDPNVSVDGGGAISFGGGRGGNGGAVWADDGAAISGSSFTSNSAGAGGPGGTATGGGGGVLFLPPAPATSRAGNGGGGVGGAGGPGGSGGAVYVAVGSGNLTTSSFISNTTGTAGNGGAGTGGGGAGIGDLSGSGGGAGGGAGGAPGDGGAIASAAGTGSLVVSSSTFNANSTVAGGAGGAATAGSAGFTDAECQQNAAQNCVGPTQGGAATGGAGQPAGDGAAIATSGGGRLTNVTANANAAGTGGAGGAATAGNGTPAGTPTGGAGGANGAGGAIANLAANTTLQIRSATLSANGLGDGGAGGAPNGADGAAGDGGAIVATAGTVNLAGSIVDGNDTLACESDGGAVITDGGGNVLAPAGDSSCPGKAGNSGLGPLRNNGGPVFTQAPSAGGAAIDEAGTTGCPATDARGAHRPFGSACDAGAYELTPPSATTGLPSSISATGATLNASVDPQGPPATVVFQYGKTTSYGSQTAAQSLTPEFGAEPVTAAISGLTQGTVTHYRVMITTADGSDAGADATFTAGQSGSGSTGARDRTAPKLRGVRMSARAFRVAKQPTKLRAGIARQIPRGTVFHLRLSEAASVSFAIAHRTTARRHGKRVVRYRASGTLRRSGLNKGAASVPFSGRLGTRALTPGRYRVRIRATDPSGNRSKAVTLKFKVLRG
jgi:CSLREA domain-containing protein